MKYKLILFDADDTLFDFRGAEKAAFAETMGFYGFDLNVSEYFLKYKKINSSLWLELEKGQITKEFLGVERFRKLFEEVPHLHDLNLVAEKYLELLSLQALLIEDSVSVCEALKKICKIGIVTNGFQKVQKPRLEKSHLAAYFDLVVISEECGFAKPDVRIFKHALERAVHDDPRSVLMVGDRLETDIVGGAAAGFDTCWFNPDRRENLSETRPTFEISSLTQLLKLIL